MEMKECPVCAGTGMIEVDNTYWYVNVCDECMGAGEVPV